MNTIKFTLSLVLLCGTLFAQPGPPSKEMREKIESQRIAFLTDRMDLTPKEAKAFWPVYNKYRDEHDAILGIGDPNHKPPHRLSDDELNNMSDTEVRKMLTDEMEKQKSMVNLREKYFNEFAEILPIKKVAKLYDAEREFQRKLMQEISRHHDEKRK